MYNSSRKEDEERARHLLKENTAAKYHDAAKLWIRNVLPLIARTCGVKNQTRYTVRYTDFIGYQAVPLWVIADILKAEGVRVTQVYEEAIELDFCGE